MKKIFLFITLVIVFQQFAWAQAGDDRLKEVASAAQRESQNKWVRVGGLGFDLSGLGIINPRVGAGVNRFGIGGLGVLTADKKMEKWFWENMASLQLGVVRVGFDPFTKSIDVLRGTSKYGYSITADKKWYAAGLLVGTTSLLKTYQENRLNSENGLRSLFSQFLAPAQLQFHPGFEWRPNENFSMLLSPIGLNLIYVGNDQLARLNLHGNDPGKNNRTELVPAINATYKRKFFNERVSYTSNLNLTTNYLKNPFTITALNFWQNNISIALLKNLSLDLYGEANYDHHRLVQKDVNGDGKYSLGNARLGSDGNPIITNGIPHYQGVDRLGRGTQWLGSFLLKYNKIF